MEHLSPVIVPAISTLLSSAIIVLVGAVWRRLKQDSEERKTKEKEQRKFNENLAQGVRAGLHDRLKQSCKYHIELGYCSISDRKNLKYLFDAYIKLNGNSIIEDLYSRAMALPIMEEE